MYDFTPQGRLLRVTTWKDTIERCKGKQVVASNKYNDVPLPEEFAALRKHSSTRLIITQRDCIDVAQEYATKGKKVMLLNMADWGKAGGLVQGGVATQEEECFRRSDYHLHLLQSFYPLTMYDYIVSRGVQYFKGSDATGFADLEEPFNVDMIASPALAGPRINHNCTQMTDPEEIDIMRNKIRQLIWAAATNNNDVLVLSAWGCGAFACPPMHIAQLFKEVIHETSGALPIIVFAIFPAHPSVKGTERDSFKVFSQIMRTDPPGAPELPTLQ
jgi:uncharacterized protein (TIGR02452 family)